MAQIKKIIDKEWLNQKYTNEKMSFNGIAKIVKCSVQTIQNRMIEYNITPRTSKEAVKYSEIPHKIKIDKDWLNQKYTIEKLSAPKIAKILNCGTRAVTQRLWKYEITVRNTKEAMMLLNRSGKNNNFYGKKHSEVTTLKMSKNHIDVNGENNPSWKGGKSFEPYPIKWNNQLRESIRKRDNYKCQVCGCTQEENNRKLDVHHIDYVKENLDPNNLISLCKPCHMKTNTNREYWIQYFIDKEILLV